MIGIKHYLTRLVIVALVMLAIWIAREPIAKSFLIHEGTQFVGAVVEVNKLQLNSADEAIFLNELEVSDPQFPNRNLIQAEAVRLELAREELAWRRFVIPRARLSQVKFGAPRASSGSLKGAEPAVELSLDGIESDQDQAVDENARAMARLSQQFRDSLTVDLRQKRKTPGFEVNSLIDSLTPKWAQGFQAESEVLAQIASDLDSANKLLIEHERIQNRLRAYDRTIDAASLLKNSRARLEAATKSIGELEDSAQSDRELLSSTQTRDRQRMISTGEVQEFDGQLLNELLVGELEQRLVEESLVWFRQFRDAVPVPDEDFGRVKRGRDFFFGSKTQPGLVINQCEVDGEGLFGQHRFRFAGTINNVSSRPKTNPEPITFELFANGPSQLRIRGSLDRREFTGEPVDKIELVGSGMEQPAAMLGGQRSLLVSMAAGSSLHVEASIQSTGEKISGELEFTFDNVALHVDEVTPAAGGREIAARVNESLSSIRTFKITSTLGGTSQVPDSSFVSTLGPKTAGAMESIFVDALELAARKQENVFRKQVELQANRLSKDLNVKIRELTRQKNQLAKKLERIDERLRIARDPLSIRRNLK